MNKIVLSLLIILAMVLIPRTSVSKGNGPETVVLSKTNTLVLGGDVYGDSVSAVISKAKELDYSLNSGRGHIITNKEPLYLFLNTPGGSIQSGLEMIEALNGIGRPVNTITLFAASMGFQIAQNLNDRLVLKNGVLMSHRAAGEFQGSFGGIQPSQVDNRYKFWLDRVKEMDDQTVSRTMGKQTYETYTKQYQNEMWLTGTKAVEQGYADRIVVAKCDSSLNGVSTKHASILGFDIAYDLDNCPLNSSPMNIRISSLDGKTLTSELTNEVTAKFLASFENKQKQVVPMYW